MRSSPDVALSTLAAVIPHVANPTLTHAKSRRAGSEAAAGNAAGWLRTGHQGERAVFWAPCRQNFISILLTCSSAAVSPMFPQFPPTLLSRDNRRPSHVSPAESAHLKADMKHSGSDGLLTQVVRARNRALPSLENLVATNGLALHQRRIQQKQQVGLADASITALCDSART